MNKTTHSKNITIVNFVIVCYFILLWLISNYNINLSLVTFFAELFTIPLLIAQLVFLVIGICHIFKGQRHLMTLLSVLLLALCSYFTITSFWA